MQRKIFLISLISLISLGSLSAQSNNKQAAKPRQITFTGTLNPYPEKPVMQRSAHDTLKILAVMVDFQEDKDAQTVGNGKFGSNYTKQYGNTILDPLPHNDTYFASHLEFARNYYQKVSGGMQSVNYTVMPSIITVSKTMRSYSPPNNSDDLTALGTLAKEVWTIFAAQNPGFKFSDYDLFTVFHAGVGRDVSMPGSFGNEKDLPSVYLSDNAIRKMFPTDLSGLPVNNQGKINTMFIPETESREEQDITGAIQLLQISINGLIVANIASHLGLPDLYDTKTGMSAIGRFGLMDGQAIFTYNGMFPPEPSPWEKIFLGWATPTEVSLKGGNISLAAKLAASAGDTTILKVPITATEYYLVENRNRDVNKDGAKVTYRIGNDTFTKTFLKDTTGFYYYSADSLQGVITDVDEYDWALPGSGILIWHIDDEVITHKIGINQVNTDKFLRGVDVEEADGVQEIGESFTTVFGDQVVGEGTEFDLWYAGNKATLYKNRFDATSVPATISHYGAGSLISFTDFSTIANKMTFKLAFGVGEIKPIAATKLSVPANKLITLQNGQNNVQAVLGSDGNLFVLSADGRVADSVLNFSTFTPVGTMGDKALVVGAYNDKLNFYSLTDHTLQTITVPGNIQTPPVIIMISPVPSKQTYRIFVFAEKEIYTYSYENHEFSTPSTLAEWAGGTVSNANLLAVSPDFASIALSGRDNSGKWSIFFEEARIYPVADSVIKIAIAGDLGSLTTAVALTNTGKIFTITHPVRTNQFSASTSNNTVSSFSLGSLKNDGQNYIVYANGTRLDAVNFSGAEAEHFPFEDPLKIGFTGTPKLIASGDKSSYTIIYAVTKDGRIFAINSMTGELLDGFPISAGKAVNKDAFILGGQSGQSAVLSLLTEDNYFYSWNVPGNTALIYWGSEAGNSFSQSFAPDASSGARVTEFFPKERAYNYPNPVYGAETYIRYFVNEDSKVNIKIFDLAGDFVAELSAEATGGRDNETVWNVSNIQSGVYMARIEVQGRSQSDNKVIKIAVIK